MVGMMNSPGKGKPVVGIVGGIGSGKSAVSARLGEMGCDVIDCDKLGHAVLEDEQVRVAIRGRWGAGVFLHSGEVSRDALGERVFSDPAELKALGEIMYPRIRERIVERIAAGLAGPCLAVVIDAAVLFEAGWDDLCSHVVFVDAPAEERFARVRRGRGWDYQKFQAREKLQIPLDIKRHRCCYTASNSSSISHLHEECDRVLRQIIRG